MRGFRVVRSSSPPAMHQRCNHFIHFDVLINQTCSTGVVYACTKKEGRTRLHRRAINRLYAVDAVK